MPANMSFHLTGGPGVRITVTQLPDGKLQVTAAINAAALVGDLRGLFFHVADASLLGGLSVSDATSPVSAFQQSANAVSNLGAGVTMAGSAQPFDVGIAFGTASAAGADDIRTVSFTLDHDTQALTLDTVAQLQFGAVLTSVGAAAGARFATIRATGASPGNVAPTATPDTGTVDEGQSVLLDVLLNDTDPTSDPLTITAFTPPAAGSVSLEAGKLRFDTAGAFEDLGDGDSETVTFGYTVSDGRGGSAAGSVQVVVNGVNDAPTEIALDDTSVPENSAFGTLVGLLSSADIDGGPATYSLIGPAVPFAIDGNRLEVDGALDFETQSSWAITVRADDGAGGIVDQAFSITVTDVDEGGGNVAPTVTDDSRTVAEDGVLVASLAGLVTDPDSAAFTFAIVGTPPTGLVLNPDGSYTYTPPADFDGDVQFQFTANDGSATSNTGIVAIDVTPVNDTPTVADDSRTVAEDGVLNASLADLVTDPDSAAFTFAIVGAPPTGLVLNPDGSYTYTPPVDFDGDVQFQFTANDGSATSNTGTVSIDVTPVNDTPTVTDDSRTVAEDGVLVASLAGLVTDPDSAAFTFAIVGTPPTGLVLNPDGSYTYTPPVDFDGDVQFQFTADDGSATSNTGTVSIDVTPVNDTPTVTDDSRTVAEDGVLVASLAGLVTDPDSAAFTFAIVGAPPTGLVLNPDGSYTYTPPANFDGDVQFQFTANDGSATSNTGTVSIDVTPVNDAPTAIVLDDASIAENSAAGTLVGLLSSTDVDGGPATYSLIGPAVPFAIDGNRLEVDGALDFETQSSWSITVRADDGAGGIVDQAFSITVTDVDEGGGNVAPTVTDDSRTVAEDGVLVASLAGLVTDPDSAAFTFAIVGAPPTGLVLNPDGSYTYTPPVDFHGDVQFQFTADDGSATSNTGTVSIDVTPVNDTPTVTDDSRTVAEDGVLVASLAGLVTDPDSAAFTFAIVGAPPTGLVLNPDGSYTYTPPANFDGDVQFQFTANDGSATSNTGTVSIDVTPVNDAPTAIVLDDASIAENSAAGTLVGLLSSTDVDGGPATYSLIGPAVPFAIDGNRLEVDGALDFETQSSWAITVRADDGAGGIVDQAFSITVTDVDEGGGNVAPTVTDDSRTVAEDGVLVASLAGLVTDPDSAAFTFAIVGAPPTGLVLNPDGSYTYTPPANFDGDVQFQFTANDGSATSNTGTVAIDVTPVNDAPTAPTGVSATIDEDTLTHFPFAALLAGATDVDGDPLVFLDFLGGTNAIGSVDATGLNVGGAPDHNGAALASYRISDGQGGIATGTVSLTINPVNDAPVVTSANLAGTEDQPYLLSIGALLAQVASDPDLDPVSFVSATSVAGGAIDIAGDTLTFTPTADFNGTGWFLLTVSDGTVQNSNWQYLSFADVNDAPTAEDDFVARQTGPQQIAFDALFANDTDIDSPPAGWTIAGVSNQNGVSVSVDAGTRTLTVDYLGGHAGAYSFDYTVSDGEGGSDTATVMLNNAPTAVDDVDTIGENEGYAVWHHLDVTANDTDPDGDALAVQSVTVLDGAPVIAAVLNDSEIRYYVNDPNQDWNGAFALEVTVSDQRGGTDTSRVDVTVTPEDDPPKPQPDFSSGEIVATGQFTPVDIPFATLLANDAHPDGTPFEITAVGSPHLGTAALVDTNGDTTADAVRFTPMVNDGSFYQYGASWLAYFYYTVTEVGGDGDSAQTWAYVRVDDVNEAPHANDDTVARGTDPQVIAFDTLFSNDLDYDSPVEGWTITGVSAESGVVVTVDPGARTMSVDYQAGHVGNYGFTYTLSDGEGATDMAVVTLNTAPLANDDAATVDENQAYAAYQFVNVTANDGDVDGDTLSLTGVTVLGGAAASAFVWSPSTIAFVLTDPYANDDFQIQYTVGDGRGGTDVGVLSVDVTPQNDPPYDAQNADDALATAEDTPLQVSMATLLADDVDPEGDALSVFGVTGSFGGSVSLAGGIATFTPSQDFNGNSGFYYRAQDVHGAVGNFVFVPVTVSPVDDPVTANDDFIARLPGSPASQIVSFLQLTGNDQNPDLDALRIVSVQSPSGGTATLNDNATADSGDDYVTFDFTAGPASFQYTVSDGVNSTSSATVYFNGAPTAVDDALAVDEAQATYSPSGSRRDIYIDRTALVGNDSDPENSPLYVNSPVSSSPENRWDTDVIERVDYYGSSVRVVLLDPDFDGETWFDYRAYDFGSAASSADDAYSEPARVTLTIGDGDDAPLADWDAWYLNGASYFDTNPATNPMAGVEDEIIELPVSLLLDGQFIGATPTGGADFDEEGAPLEIDPGSLSSSNGQVALVDVGGVPTIRFTPDANVNGDLYFYYTVNDGNQSSGVAGVNLWFEPVNDAPQADDADLPVPLGQTEHFIDFDTLLGFVTDADHGDEELTLVDVQALSGGSVFQEAGGLRFYVDGSGDPLTFSYRYEDPEGLSSNTAVITLEPTEPTEVALFFSGNDPDGTRLWQYVPQQGPGVSVALESIDFWSTDYRPELITRYGDGVVFAAAGIGGLYAYSQSGGVDELLPYYWGEFVSDLRVVDDQVFAIGGQGLYGFGVGLPDDRITAGSFAEGLRDLTEGNGTVFFTGSDGGSRQVYRYDQDNQSIEQLTFFAPDEVSDVRDLAATSDGVYFVADVIQPGGSDDGVLFRVDLDDDSDDGWPYLTRSSYGYGADDDANARSLVAVGEQVFFIATTPSGADRLWVADDTGANQTIWSVSPDGTFDDLSKGPKELLPFADGVLASFLEDGGGAFVPVYGSAGDFYVLPDASELTAPRQGQVVAGEAFFTAFDFTTGDGAEVYVFDGSDLQQLTQHEASGNIDELEVRARDRLFVSGPDDSQPPNRFVFEYSPGTYGDTLTHRLDRAHGPELRNLSASDDGLYFEYWSQNIVRTYFADATGAWASVEGSAVSTNRDRGFQGQMPLSSFADGNGAEPTFFAGTSPQSSVDLMPGVDPDFTFAQASSHPTAFTQLDDGNVATIDPVYLLATEQLPGPDAAHAYRLEWDGSGWLSTVVDGLSAVGNPTDTAAERHYLFAQYALGDVTAVLEGIWDPLANAYTAFPLWLVQGTTATQIDDDAGFVTATEIARAGDLILWDDEHTANGAELGRYDLATDTAGTIDINPGPDGSDPRELVTVGDAVYARAITSGAGLDGDIELVRVAADGSSTVIDLEDDGGFRLASWPRQLTAVDDNTVAAFGDSEAGPRLWLVTGTSVDQTVDLWAAGIDYIPFLDGGTEVYDGGLFFFGHTWDGGGIQLFRYDLVSGGVANITQTPDSGRGEFEHSMEVADGLLWFVFDAADGSGMELNTYDGTSWAPVTDLDATGYDPFGLVATSGGLLAL